MSSGLFKRVNLPMLVLLMLLTAALVVSCCCAGGIDDEEIDLNLNEPVDNPIPPNAVISATPDNGLEPLEVQLDASDSSDPDGVIVSYDWDFDGDGTYDLMDGGPTPMHTYDSTEASSVSFVQTGSFSPKVRVTDDDGLTDEASTTVTIGELVPPVAAGTAAQEDVGLTTAVFDGSASSDEDGTVEQWDWDWDSDGTYDLLDGGATPAPHDYGGFGSFTATLRVTDNDGLTDTTEIDVTLTEPANEPPVADLVPTPETGDAPLDVSWDASGSSDPDGTIVQYDWDMDNDGTFEIIDGGDSQAANYPTGGDYTVGVRVTDDDGATDQTTASVNVNNPPVADLVPVPDSGAIPLTVHWDASGSTDSDGTIEQYDWDMDNDGTFELTDGGDSQDVVYPDSGSHTVGVRVTDDDGATDETTATANALIPPVADLQAEPDTGTVPLDVVWHAEGSTDADGTIEQYDWDMDNDGTFELIDDTATQSVNYTAGGLITVGVRVTDNDGLTDQTTLTIDLNDPPTAMLDSTTELISQEERWDIHWDATASFDTDGTIVTYDWDLDNDGTYEVLDGGPTQTTPYMDWEFTELPTVWVRVTDDDGAQDETSHTATFPPFAFVEANPNFVPSPVDVTWDASASWDPDGGSIVQYDWDMDHDGTYEIIDGGPTQMFHYDADGTYFINVRVIDDEGETAETEGFLFLTTPA